MRRTHANGKVLISIDGLPITLIPFVPMKGLTADENVKIITALIVSDEVYSEYVNPDTVTVYHNFCIPSETVEADGLMVSIMEARDLLKPSACTAKAIWTISDGNYFMSFPAATRPYTWVLCF